MSREPLDASVLSARLAKAFPALSAYSAAVLAEDLCRIERAQRRHAERCCNGDYYRVWNQLGLTDHREERAGKRILRQVEQWQHRRRSLLDLRGSTYPRWDSPDVQITLHNDPRGPVLLLKLPGEQEAVAV